RQAEFDRDILALGVAGLGKALSECREQAGVWLRRAGMQESDHRYLRLLRARRERPRSCPAEQRDELAPFHLTEMHPIPSRAGSTSQDTGLQRISQRVACQAPPISARSGRCRAAIEPATQWPFLKTSFLPCASVTLYTRAPP